MRHVLVLALVLATGCEAVVHFDRSKIDGGMNSAARASALVAGDGGAAAEATETDEPPSDDEDDR
jgi:hypothetical protein